MWMKVTWRYLRTVGDFCVHVFFIFHITCTHTRSHKLSWWNFLKIFYGTYTENVAHAHSVCTRPSFLLRGSEDEANIAYTLLTPLNPLTPLLPVIISLPNPAILCI